MAARFARIATPMIAATAINDVWAKPASAGASMASYNDCVASG